MKIKFTETLIFIGTTAILTGCAGFKKNLHTRELRSDLDYKIGVTIENAIVNGETNCGLGNTINGHIGNYQSALKD